MFIPNKGTVIIPYLYFEIYPKEWYDGDKVFAFRPDSLKADNMIEKITKITNPSMNVNKMVIMTDDGKSAMKEFIPHNRDSKIDWSKMWSAKIVDNKTIVCLNNTRIESIVRKMYGGYDSEGSRIDYEIKVNKPVTMDNTGVYNGIPQNFVLEIHRAKDNAMRRAAEGVGLMYGGSGIPSMIKAVRN